MGKGPECARDQLDRAVDVVVVDVQRGGPSTGLPTKTEQADLLQAMFGRNGEAPVPIIAPRSPGDCFDAAIEAVRIATAYRTPVILLFDGDLANGAEAWRLPDFIPLCYQGTLDPEAVAAARAGRLEKEKARLRGRKTSPRTAP